MLHVQLHVVLIGFDERPPLSISGLACWTLMHLGFAGSLGLIEPLTAASTVTAAAVLGFRVHALLALLKLHSCPCITVWYIR
jgi:hypothetical protein